VFCAVCQRRMQGLHAHGVAYYRCRYPQEYALANKIDHPRNVILREDVLITPLDRWLVGELAPDRRERTIAAVLARADIGRADANPLSGVEESLTVGYESRLARYRAALDAGADPLLVAGWIAEVQAEHAGALERLRRTPSTPGSANGQTGTHLTPEHVTAILDELGDLVTALADADPDHKADVYRGLGLRMTYHPDTQTVRADVDLSAHRWSMDRVEGGDLNPHVLHSCARQVCMWLTLVPFEFQEQATRWSARDFRP
jgi:site-specific DNA recombinase